jgi:hypothetical protein
MRVGKHSGATSGLPAVRTSPEGSIDRSRADYFCRSFSSASFVAALDQEIARLQQARALLPSAVTVKALEVVKKGPGRPKTTGKTSAPKREMSAE